MADSETPFLPTNSSVLNAFRHQRSWRRWLFLTPSIVVRAQRLSASEIMAADHKPYPKGSTEVLNAFRHQRSWRFNGNGIAARISRAQRLSASEIMAVAAIRPGWSTRMCSTPFGIRDHGGNETTGDHGPRVVLNAFRHQRSWRPLSPAARLRSIRCSTPFGIRDHGGVG